MRPFSIFLYCFFFSYFAQASVVVDSTDFLICCYTEDGLLVSDITYEVASSNIVVDDCFDLTDIAYPITISPSKNNNHNNGVTTLDLILMTRHILGVKNLDSPYKMIAADVNNDGKVSTVDVIRARQLILQITPTYLNNNSWRFIPASYTFPSLTNPWLSEFPEYNYEIEDPISRSDFIAIKVGDVNGNAIPE